jgi:hypothetical protein
MRPIDRSDADSLRCSFCRKTQEVVASLFSSPSDYPRAYICDECVAVCGAVLEDQREKTDAPASGAPLEPHPLIGHPLVSQLLASVVDWMRQESLGNDASEEVARMRSIAARIIASP